MNLSLLCLSSCFVVVASSAMAAGSGPVFYGDPPDEHHPWAIHDRNRPQPRVVTPGTFSTQDLPGKPPADAVILFDGTDLSKWEANNGKPAGWIVRDGYMEASKGDIRTKEKFGDCQLHIEWAAPKEVKGDSQGRGNSGVFLMGLVEIQVLDNYDNPTYADGYAGSVYEVNPPLVNALRRPGEYQVYDIVFRRPIYKDGQVLDPGYVTVFVNGVLAQDHTMLEGGTGHMTRTKIGPLPEKGPLSLQDHGSPVRFRNVWYRPLPPRAVEGGTDGYLTTEATMAKRKQIATSVREDAAKMSNPLDQLFRYMESLIYEKTDATYSKVEQMAGNYVSSLKALAPDKLAGKKDEAKHLAEVFNWLARFKIIPNDFAPKAQVQQLIKDQGWDKKTK